MGWLWSSSPGDSGAASTKEPSASTPPTGRVALTDEQRSRIFGQPTQSPPPQNLSREQHADAELEDLIRQFQAADPDTPSKSTLDSALPAQNRSEPPPISRTLPDGTLDISPDAIYPRTMSCRQQFDQAFYCQSLGGKFNDIYRYGHLRSCSEHWAAWRFCMRMRTIGEKDKGERIKEFYKERHEKQKEEKGSSEDVWELRTVAVEKAFWKDPNKE